MDVRQLRCFVAVADELHFGKAAEKLALAPPALSRTIRTLENELGVDLLVRTTRQVGLTRAGLTLLEEAKAILARLETAARSVRDAASSSSRMLRIGAIDSASASFLPEIMVAFRQIEPGVQIRFVEAMTAPLIGMLETGRLDLCLTRPPRRLSDCRFEVLRVERPMVLLPARHPLAAKPLVTILDLVGEPFVIPSKRGRPYAYDLAMSYFDSVGAVPNVVLEATGKPAMLSAVAAGLGVALVPDWVARLSFPGVVMRLLKGAMLDPPPAGALVGMAWRPHQRLASRDAMLDLLRARVPLIDPGAAAGMSDPPPAPRRPVPRAKAAKAQPLQAVQA